MALHELVYVSLAVRPLQTSELVALLDRARAHNAAHGITGMLLYQQQDCMQLIEGEEADVKALFERIRADARHQQLHVMWEGPLGARSFEGWYMGFVAPEDEALIGYPGYVELRASGLFTLGDLNVTRGRRLLMSLSEDLPNLS